MGREERKPRRREAGCSGWERGQEGERSEKMKRREGEGQAGKNGMKEERREGGKVEGKGVGEERGREGGRKGGNGKAQVDVIGY